MNNTHKSHVRLQKPGAGLPFFEWVIARYILMPQFLKEKEPEILKANFASTSRQVSEMCAQFPIQILSTPVLIPRVRGLEDSSRNWSIALTLEHLIITNGRLAKLLPDLAAGEGKLAPVKIADVKPRGAYTASDIIAIFNESVDNVLKEVNKIDLTANLNCKLPHPWFGPLNALEWLAFAPQHTNIHREQIKRIASALNS